MRPHLELPSFDDFLGGPQMRHRQHDRPHRNDRNNRSNHHNRPRRRHRPSPPRESFDEALLSDEERRYRDAHRIAERKVKLTRDATRVGLIGLALLIFIPPVGAIMLIWCGIGLFKEFYQLILEPKVRTKLIEHELQQHIESGITRERQSQGGRHARSLENLSASIAHEIRNPITAAKSLVQQMEEEPTAAENVEYARVALEELHRVEKSVSHLLRFARDERSHVELVNLADVVDSALETFRDRIARTGVALERQVDCKGELRGDSEQLRRIVINLVGNAIDALVESGTPEPHIDVQMGENLAGSEVWLRVRDNGPGVDRELLAKMFSPFYTSKVNGTGLGLAICKKLVDAHGGSIEVTSEPGDGAEFIVTFPKAREERGGLA